MSGIVLSHLDMMADPELQFVGDGSTMFPHSSSNKRIDADCDNSSTVSNAKKSLPSTLDNTKIFENEIKFEPVSGLNSYAIMHFGLFNSGNNNMVNRFGAYVYYSGSGFGLYGCIYHSDGTASSTSGIAISASNIYWAKISFDPSLGSDGQLSITRYDENHANPSTAKTCDVGSGKSFSCNMLGLGNHQGFVTSRNIQVRVYEIIVRVSDIGLRPRIYEGSVNPRILLGENTDRLEDGL